jgi:hypothetical protein
MAKKRRRRLKKDYAGLFDRPWLLWPDCEVLLWPNGEPEIWVRSRDGRYGFRITAGHGPAGFGLTVGKFACATPITVGGNLQEDMEPFHAGDAFEVSMCQYHSDPHSQAFKLWYAGKGPHPDEKTPEVVCPPRKARLRVVVLNPYRRGEGPYFSLVTWDAGKDRHNKWMLGYRLAMYENNRRTILFQGEDFGCSPLHAIDSDAAVRGIMTFLTLCPGDTDREYFQNYTQEQLDYCAQHAEALSAEVAARFGED